MVFSVVEMFAQLFLLIWIAHNGAQAASGGSIWAGFFFYDKSLDLLKLACQVAFQKFS